MKKKKKNKEFGNDITKEKKLWDQWRQRDTKEIGLGDSFKEENTKKVKREREREKFSENSRVFDYEKRLNNE